MEGEGDSKAPRRAHLESAARQGEPWAIHELANIPQLPAAGAHLWGYFVQLGSTRQSGGMGPSPLSRAEIRLWEEDEAVELAQWERRAILALDALWLRSLTARPEDDDQEEG